MTQPGTAQRRPGLRALPWAVAVVAATGAGGLGACQGLLGQEPGSARDSAAVLSAPVLFPPVPAPGWAERFQVVERPGAPVTAVAVVLPVGSATDPVGGEGAGWILADAVARSVTDDLGNGRVEAAARVEPDRTTLTFLTRTRAVPELLDAFRNAAFASGPRAAAVAAARESRVEELAFQQDSPVLEVNRASRRLIYGSEEARVHAPGGTLASVEALDPGAIEGLRRTAYRPGDAVVVVVGAIAAAREELDAGGDSLSAEMAPQSSPMRIAGQVPASPAGPVWSGGAREVVERPVTNSWITVAWPVPDGVPPIAVDFIAHRMERELNPSPPDPGVFHASVEVVCVPGGEVLVVRAAVQPGQTDAMESRILSLPRGLSEPLDDTFFLWYRRQFRADRLLAEAPPEAAARQRARQILQRGSALDVAEEIWRLTPGVVAETAEALGRPRVLVFGPPVSGQ